MPKSKEPVSLPPQRSNPMDKDAVERLIPDEECLPQYFNDEPIPAKLTESAPELKPCPFCGGEAYTQSYEALYFVGCMNCFCAVGEGYDASAMPNHQFHNREEAIAAWNTRAAAQPDGWIAVEDDLPTPGLNVLIIASGVYSSSQHYTAYRTEPLIESGHWFWRDSHTGAQTIWASHWQPLPTPPVQAVQEGS